jgi:hypothetical protein
MCGPDLGLWWVAVSILTNLLNAPIMIVTLAALSFCSITYIPLYYSQVYMKALRFYIFKVCHIVLPQPFGIDKSSQNAMVCSLPTECLCRNGEPP